MSEANIGILNTFSRVNIEAYENVRTTKNARFGFDMGRFFEFYTDFPLFEGDEFYVEEEWLDTDEDFCSPGYIHQDVRSLENFPRYRVGWLVNQRDGSLKLVGWQGAEYFMIMQAVTVDPNATVGEDTIKQEGEEKEKEEEEGGGEGEVDEDDD